MEYTHHYSTRERYGAAVRFLWDNPKYKIIVRGFDYGENKYYITFTNK